MLESRKFNIMPNRCVVYSCSNTPNLKEGIPFIIAAVVGLPSLFVVLQSLVILLRVLLKYFEVSRPSYSTEGKPRNENKVHGAFGNRLALLN